MEISKSEASLMLYALSVTANETGLGDGSLRLRIKLARYAGLGWSECVGNYEADLAAYEREEMAAIEREKNPPAFVSRRRELRLA